MTATASRPSEATGLAARELPPPPDRDAVCRPRLVASLSEHSQATVAVLVAPAGYGKTAVLCEWAMRDHRPFAWLTLDERDNEPMRLLSRLTHAVDGVASDDPAHEFVLVLDDLHALHRPQAVEVLCAVAADLPPEAMLALASRTEPPLPIARLRAQRRLVELRAEQLAMRSDEVTAVLRADGREVEHDGLATLLHTTEGWPAGLSLAMLAGPRALNGFGGEESVVSDYLRDEMLSTLAPRRREFLRRTSVLDVLTGPACDALLERADSSAVLAEMARGNLLLVALDHRGERYRYHHLLADTLRAELRRVEPALEPDLHRCAARWYRHAGDLDRAVRHALAAGDVRDAATLVWRNAATEITHGRGAIIDRWLERFTRRQTAASAPLALTAAGRSLALGRGDLVDHWIAAATAASGAEAPRPVAAGIAAMRAAIAHHGLGQAADDAAEAAELSPDDGPCRGLSCLAAGVAAHLTGDREAAGRELAEGVRRAAVTAPSLHALCLTQLAILAQERDDLEEAAGLLTRARAQIDRFALADDAGSALVFAASACVRAHRGRIEEAQQDLQAATRLQAGLTDYAPWFEVEVRILNARTALRLCDVADADARLKDVARLMRLVPEAVVLAEWLAQARAGLSAFAGPEGVPPSSLTIAELRILRYLPTHLSFREIADRTFVSANTVKTQANAVYRKLDVSCRSDAVTRARELGLLDPP